MARHRLDVTVKVLGSLRVGSKAVGATVSTVSRHRLGAGHDETSTTSSRVLMMLKR